MSLSIQTIKKYWLDLVIIVLISGFFCLYGLGQNSFGDGDQTIHAKVTQEMVHSGNWWTPTRRGIPYFSKPPFQMWLSAIVVSLFGESNVTYRLVSALSGVATYLFTFLFAIYLFKDRRTAWLSFLLLIGCRRIMFAHGFREAVQDGMLYFLTALSMYFFWVVFEETEKFRTKTSTKAWAFSALGGMTVGLAILTKHAAGLLPIAMIGVFLLVTKRLFPILKHHWKPLLLAFSLSLIVPACFFVPHMLQTRSVFNVMFYHEIYKRATVGYHYRHNTWLYVYEIFHNRGTVPPELLTVALIWGSYLFYKKHDLRMAFLLCWSVVPVALFTPMNSRLMWYISPAIPGIAILSGVTLNYLLANSLDRLNEWKRVSNFEKMRLAFILGFSVFSVYSSIKGSAGILHTILNSEKLFASERVTSEILKQSSEKAPSVAASYNAPTLTRYEELYWARVGLDKRKNQDLATVINDQSIKYVLTSPESALEIIEKRAVVGYVIYPPRSSRTRWLVILSFDSSSELPFGFEKTTQEINLVNKAIYQIDAAGESQLKLEGSYFPRHLGATLTLTINKKDTSTENITNFFFNGQKIKEIDIKESNNITLELPKHLWKKNQNIASISPFNPLIFTVEKATLKINFTRN